MGIFNSRNGYKDYHLQSRLHFRIHASQSDLKAKLKRQSDDTNPEEEEFLDAESGEEDAIEATEDVMINPEYSLSCKYNRQITEQDAAKILQESSK